jgi:hypothetical protein
LQYYFGEGVVKMKKLSLIAIFVVLAMFVGCSNNADKQVSVDENKTVSFSVSNTTITQKEIETETTNSTKNNCTQNLTTQNKIIESTTAENNTKANTTTSENTTSKATTKSNETKSTIKTTTTTKKQTTTVVTTTKKVTTTKSSHCTNNNNHSVECGNMGKWFNSKADVRAYVNSVMQEWADKEERGEISRQEYYDNCPQGYECWSCSYCGKWTGNFK